MQTLPWQQAFRAEEFAVSLPQADLLDLGALCCAKKYRKEAQRPSAKEMVNAAACMEKGLYEEGGKCARSALAGFQGDTLAMVDAIRLIVYAHTAQGKLKDAHVAAYAQLEGFCAQSDKAGEARMLLLLAHINLDKRGSRNRERAKEWALRARQLFAEREETKLEAQALLALVNVVLKDRRDCFAAAEETKQLVGAAVPLLRSVKDVAGEGVAMHGLACARALVGSSEGAAEAGREALELFRQAKQRRFEAFELHCIAVWLINKDSDGAIEAAEESLEIYVQEKQQAFSQEAAVLRTLMRAYADSKAFNRAVETAREALERYESGGRKAQAAALEMLALGLSQCGELLEAVKATQQQAAILLEEGDKTGRARALRSLCRLCAHHRDFEQGIEAASEAASISAELNQSEQALALQLLADCHRWNDAYTDARQVAAQARQLYRRLGDRNNEVCAVLQACHASALGGDRATALELAGEAQDIAKRAGCKSLQGICWQALASLHWDWGRLADALKMAKKALACARRAGNCKDECRCILLLVIMNLAISQCQDDSGTGSQEQASRRSSRLQAAEELAEEASRLSDVAGDAECSACSLHAIAMVQIQAQRYDEAFRTAQEAMKKYQEIQDLMGILQMFLGMAKILLQARSFEEAAAAAESALWLAEQAGCKEMEEQARAALEEVEQAAEAESSRGSRPRSRSSSNARVPELPNLPKLELAQACDPQLVRGVIEKFVNVLIGSDDLVEPDRPLMEMGLTSHLAVVLRDQLAKVLPVLTPPLPVTLIYDYPSTAAISQLVVASAGASLRRTRA